MSENQTVRTNDAARAQSYDFGQVPRHRLRVANGIAITWSVKELSNARGNMAAFVFGQARSTFLSTVRPLSRFFGKAGLFADLTPRNRQLYKIGPSRERVVTARRQALVACLPGPNMRPGIASPGFYTMSTGGPASHNLRDTDRKMPAGLH